MNDDRESWLVPDTFARGLTMSPRDSATEAGAVRLLGGPFVETLLKIIDTAKVDQHLEAEFITENLRSRDELPG